MRFDSRTYTGLGRQTLGGHKQNLVCTRTQEKGALTPHETEPDLPVRARDGNTRPADPPPEKSVCSSRSKLETDVKQRAGSTLGKECIKAVYCHPAYLTSTPNISCEMPDWMKHKLESRLQGEISITSDMQMTPPLQQKAKRNQRAS